MMEQRQSFEEENKKEESRDEEKGSEDAPGKSQEEGTPSSASCQISGFINKFFYFL